MKRSRETSWLAVGIVAWAGSMASLAHAASPTSSDEIAIRAQSTSCAAFSSCASSSASADEIGCDVQRTSVPQPDPQADSSRQRVSPSARRRLP